jgi:hypothetical protein
MKRCSMKRKSIDSDIPSSSDFEKINERER